MIIYPVNQAAPGDGNSVVPTTTSARTGRQSLQVVAYNPDGTIFTGAGAIGISVYWSNEDAKTPGDIQAPILFKSFGLSAAVPYDGFDFDSFAKHILVKITQMPANCKVTAYPM